MLLLNDKFDPNWHVFVDGKPASLLRCNFIMRGVYLTPGAHTVEFKFSLPLGLLYVSLSAIGVGILLCGFLLFCYPANLCWLGWFRLSYSADILVCEFVGHSRSVLRPHESGGWKVARTRNLENLRYLITVNTLFPELQAEELICPGHLEGLQIFTADLNGRIGHGNPVGQG